MIDYKNKPATYYFTETELKKILLDILNNDQKMLMMTLKRKALIKEFINPNKYLLVDKYITEAQLQYLNREKESGRESEYLNMEDINNIEAYYPKYPKSLVKQTQWALIHSFIEGGFRVQEICDFDVSGIDKENERIRILGKGKKWRWTHVKGSFITFLLGWKDRYDCANNPIQKNSYDQDYTPFFVNNSKKIFTPRNIQKFMEKLNDNLNLSVSLHPHLLRHTYAVKRILENPTISAEELRQDMGHEDIRTTSLYFKLADAERIKLARRRKEQTEAPKKEIETLYCKACGKEIAADFIFCKYCGEKQ